MNSEAEQLRAEAADAIRKREESFERCDTDGFLSQWSLGLSAELKHTQARLVDAGKVSNFPGLYEGERRVSARVITVKNPYSYGYNRVWLLNDSETKLIAARGKKFLPTGENSKVLKALGLTECQELAPAWAKYEGRGKGLSGTVWVQIYRTGDKWGSDARRIYE